DRIDLEWVLTREFDSLTSVYYLRNSSTGDFQITAAHAHDRAVARSVGINAVLTRSEKRESSIGRVNFDRIAGRQLGDADAEFALVQSNLQDLVVHVGYGHVSLFPHPDRVRPDLEFRPGSVVGVDAIARRCRKVECCFTPLIHAGPQERNLSLLLADASDSGGRIACWHVLLA